MVSNDIFFEAHLDNIAYDLAISPPVLYGEEAKQAAKIYGSLDRGAYLWKNRENTVVLKNKDSISTAAHELRHAWQHQYSHTSFNYKLPTKKQSRFHAFFSRILYWLTYFFNPKEIDADKFAADYCRRNKLTYDLRKVREQIIISKISRVGIPIGLIFMLSCVTYLIYLLITING
ncbi:hypothetical protein NST38_31120 [Paenibacillus sp. FSL H8-0104]|uniref:hypothetical protein n=1 Tax=Paenibacillus sp. FSL H8-0104 TaxID=2954509 RepID=UPI0030FDBB29